MSETPSETPSEPQSEASRNTASADGVAEPLAQWLSAHLRDEGPVKVTELHRPKGGYSAETWVVDAEVGASLPARFVLRRETPGTPIYPTQVPGLEVEVDIQYRIMDALARSGEVPLAPLVGYEADPAVLGQPFFVMGFIDGRVPGESPPYPSEGFFSEITAAERRQMITGGLGALAAVHRVDWRGVGLDWLIAPGDRAGIETQMALWERFGATELAGRPHPVLDSGLRWLHERTPTHGPNVFNWGDPRPGNIIFDGTRCACLTDFEASCIAPPEMDLGWWLMFDWTMHEGAGADRPAGDPNRHEQLEMYATASGRDLGDLRWFEIFAAVRYTMIVVRVMNRAVARGDLPPEQTIWLDNPASECLATLLDG